MAASKSTQLRDAVLVMITDEGGSVVLRETYPIGKYYDGKHPWDSAEWLEKKHAFEAVHTLYESDGSVDRVTTVRYATGGSVAGTKCVSPQGGVIYANGIFQGG